MTSLAAGRADAYPHAADLALIPFAIGIRPRRRALRAHARPHPPRRRALRRYRRGRRGDADGSGDAARRGVGRHPVRRAGAHRRTHRPRRAHARGGKAHRAGARRRDGRRPDHLHRARCDRAPAPARAHRAVRRHAPRVAARATARRSIGARPCRSWPSAASTATSSSARRRSSAPQPRAMALWARLTGPGRAMTAAGVAFVADMVPGAIARAAGKLGGGFSLDNALRFAAVPADRVGAAPPARRRRVARLRPRLVHGLVERRRAARDRKPDREHDARVRRGGRSADGGVAPLDRACGRRRRHA